MWGTQQGWNQWAMQPAMFNDVPHEQIDWAALAKQWIQMQQSQPPPDPSVIPPAQVAPQPVIVPPPPPGHSPIIPEELPLVSAPPLLKTPVAPGTLPEPFQPERQFETEPATFVPKPANNAYWNKSQWESTGTKDMEHVWPVHPIEPTPPIIGGKETFDYGHVHDNPPLAMQSIDYNHMSEFSYNQMPQVYVPPETQYDQYWSQVSAAPPIAPIFLKKERSTAPSSSHRTEEDTSQIDAAKRKQLPAWIREGLEKMEQERIKKIEKERAEKEKAEKLAKDKLKSESALKEGGTNFFPVKSKFDSDSESEEVVETVRSHVHKSSPPISKRSPSPDIRTEEEKRQEFLLTLRRLLTEILLEVTDSEMQAVAEETLKKEKLKKLKAQQLASTTKLTSVASGLRGLADYGSESEASDADEEQQDSSDSEEELYQIIREKKKQFAIKGKKMLADIDQKEFEEQMEALKPKNDPSKPLESIISEPNRDSTKSFVKEEDKLSIPFLAPAPDDKDTTEIPFIEAKIDSPKQPTENNSKCKKKDSNSSGSSSSSSESESSERGQNKDHKNETDKKSSKRSSNKSQSRKCRSRSSESDSSGRRHKSRSHDRYSKKGSNSKKKKKDKRSDSSSSSSSGSRRRKHSSKLDSSYNHYRGHRSESYDDKDRKHRRSVSPRGYRSSRDSYKSRESYRHDRNRYDKRDGYYDRKRSPSPHRRSSKLPKKYRSSRSLSSERESSRKSKRSRNH